MFKKIVFSSIVAFTLFSACNNAEKTTSQTAAEAIPPTRDIQDAPPPRPNLYWVTIDSSSNITFDGKEIKDLEVLQKMLTDSLKAMKKSGHPLPDTIMFRTEGTVMMGMRGALHDAINDARAAAMKDK